MTHSGLRDFSLNLVNKDTVTIFRIITLKLRLIYYPDYIQTNMTKFKKKPLLDFLLLELIQTYISICIQDVKCTTVPC
jgi:hypothetical protein